MDNARSTPCCAASPPPAVSVLIPVYNAGDHLRKCLESLAAQSFGDFEAIALDDGSTDDSLARLRDFAAAHPFLRVETQPNAGAPTTRNRLVRMARGEFAMFLDDDDTFEPDCIERFVAEARRTGADIVCGGFRRVSENGRILQEFHFRDPRWSPLVIITAWAKMFRRDFLIDNDVEFLNYGIGEDIYFCFKAYRATRSMSVFPYIGYGWTDNRTSVSNTAHRSFSRDRDPVFLLDSLYGVSGGGGLYALFYVRHVIWHLMYSGRGATPEEFSRQAGRLFEWLRLHGIPIRYPFSRLFVKARDLKAFFIVRAFLVIWKCGLTKAFARVYCRPQRNEMDSKHAASAGGKPRSS